MTNAVFVVPYVLETTLRFVRAALRVPGVRLSVVSQEPAERLPQDVRSGLAAHELVTDAMRPDQLTEAARRVARRTGGRVDRLLGVLEQLQVPLAETREQLGLPGMSVTAAHNFRDKGRMKDVLRGAGLPVARHGLARDAKGAAQIAEEIGYPLVVKPPAGAGAVATARVERRSELESYLRSCPPTPAQPLLVEEFIIGSEHSFDSVSVGGEHVFHSISRYYPTPLEVMQAPWIQWCVLLPRDVSGPEFEDIRAAGPRALSCLGMVTGLTHMEWFRRGDGSIAISEVAARPPGAQFTTLLSYAHDLDFYRAWAELMCTDRFEPPQRRWATGAAFLRGQGTGRVMAVDGIEQAQRELGGLVVEARLPRFGQASASSYEGEGYVILRHPDTEVVERALHRLVSLVQVEIG